jgi:hypothetical protein
MGFKLQSVEHKFYGLQIVRFLRIFITKTNSFYIAVFPSEIFQLDLVITGIVFCHVKTIELRRIMEIMKTLLFRHV